MATWTAMNHWVDRSITRPLHGQGGQVALSQPEMPIEHQIGTTMRYTANLLLGVLLGLNTLAQDPFTTLDRPSVVLTLTGQTYPETFQNDSIVKIGTMLFDTRLRCVVAVVQRDTAYLFGLNSTEQAVDIHRAADSTHDFGIRLLDTRAGRWLSLDLLASSYPGISPYSFALNTPIQGKDADGNVVIFINGQHGGTGGSKAYWGQYATDVKNRLGDQSARYVDGALGGWRNTGLRAAEGGVVGGFFGPWVAVVGVALRVKTSSNVNRDVRIAAGRAQGMHDAAEIIANLKEGETIKIVTHSMGTAFARGYTEGIMAYAKENGLEGKVKFEYELDVNAFQGGDLPADPNVARSQFKLGGLDGGNSLRDAIVGNSVPSVAAVPGAEDISDPSDAQKGHAVQRMSITNIPALGNGGAAQDIEQGNNNKSIP